jgi:hypothetical protein
MISMLNAGHGLDVPDTVPAVPLTPVDRDSPVPLAEQAERALRDAIASGELHGRMPDEDALISARAFGHEQAPAETCWSYALRESDRRLRTSSRNFISSARRSM